MHKDACFHVIYIGKLEILMCPTIGKLKLWYINNCHYDNFLLPDFYALNFYMLYYICNAVYISYCCISFILLNYFFF